MYNINTLLKLANNPNYKMTSKELEALEKYRAQQYNNRKSDSTVKHNFEFDKHTPLMKEENTKAKGLGK